MYRRYLFFKKFKFLSKFIITKLRWFTNMNTARKIYQVVNLSGDARNRISDMRTNLRQQIKESQSEIKESQALVDLVTAQNTVDTLADQTQGTSWYKYVLGIGIVIAAAVFYWDEVPEPAKDALGNVVYVVISVVSSVTGSIVGYLETELPIVNTDVNELPLVDIVGINLPNFELRTVDDVDNLIFLILENNLNWDQVPIDSLILQLETNPELESNNCTVLLHVFKNYRFMGL